MIEVIYIKWSTDSPVYKPPQWPSR